MSRIIRWFRDSPAAQPASSRARNWLTFVAFLVGALLIWGGIRQDDVLSCQRQNPVRDSARTFYLSEAQKNDQLADSFDRTGRQSQKRLSEDPTLRGVVARQTVRLSVAESFARRDAYSQAAYDARAASQTPAHLSCDGLFPTDR